MSFSGRFFLSILLLAGVSNLNGQGAERLTVDLLYHPEKKIDFDGSPPTISRWLKDGESYLQSQGSPHGAGGGAAARMLRVNARSGERSPLLETERLKAAFSALEGWDEEAAAQAASRGRLELSSDEQSLLITYEGDFYSYDISGDRIVRLTSSSDEQREPELSPDARKVAFIRGTDLYVVDTRDGIDRRLTHDGTDKILNGVLDWVYQEEVYGRGSYKGFWWSPDSRWIAYLQLDESPVPGFTVIDHIPQHLKPELMFYPKAGDPNPLVRLGVVSVDGGETHWVPLDAYKPEDLLIVRVDWSPDSRHVVFQAQNKEQTWLDLNFATRDGKECRRAFRETTQAWVNVLGNPAWLEDGSFLWQSERSGWKHLYHYDSGGRLKSTVTQGDWEVSSLHGVDEENGWIYFSADQRSSIGLDVYRIRLDGTQMTRLSEKPGTHRARFNHQLSLYVDSWSDVRTPTQTRLHDSSGREIRVLDANPASELSKYQLGETEFVQVKTRDGFVMEAMLIKPPGFDPSKKYPVMSRTYSGPQSPQVRDAWGGVTYLWHQYLAQEGYITWVCDNRSSSGKGAQSAWPIHRNLGELELRDLEDGLNWLKEQPWVDGDRIGLWGWSYGGYMTGYALTHSQSFKIGIVGAPVTDWTLYDTIYTERYMGTPQNNPEGYEKSSVVKAAASLHGKMLLLHGTMDDNVHLQNSIQFMYELQKAARPFEVMFYPRSRHGVRNPWQVYHMRQLMTEFVLGEL